MLRDLIRPALLAVMFAVTAACSHAASDFDAAMGHFKAKRFADAREAFRKIVAAEPANAAACHFLGRAITAARNDNAAYEEALAWLAKAVELQPRNAIYHGIYGGTSLQYARRTNSVSAATKGREAMEKAVALDPGYLDAREGLFQFYQRAPWPIGSSAKAAAHLEEIRKRDPDRATVLAVLGRANAKDYAGAFKLCDEVLAKNPSNYVALYHYGRTASISGRNLERGLDRLRRCLALEPPTPASPSHSQVWHRIGLIHERLQQAAEARAAHERAVKLDPGNRQAADALKKLG
jgi:tetratricopeptide (TPR) repeat protein